MKGEGLIWPPYQLSTIVLKIANLKSFFSHSCKQTAASHEDKRKSSRKMTPVMGPVRPPTAHHQVAIVCDCYCPSVWTISAGKYSNISRACFISHIFFFCQTCTTVIHSSSLSLCCLFLVWPLCSGGESQLHAHLQHGLSLLREPFFNPQHQRRSSGLGPASHPAFATPWLQHQPHREPLQPCIQPCLWSCCWTCLQEQPWTPLSQPHLYSREQGQWHHWWGLFLLQCWKFNIFAFASLVNYFTF